MSSQKADTSRIRAILFDFDSTLGNRLNYSYCAVRQILEENTGVRDPYQLEDMAQTVLQWDQSGVYKRPQLLKRMNEEFGMHVPCEGEEALRYWLDIQDSYVSLLPGTVETLTRLKQHYRLGCVTDGLDRYQRMKIERAGVRPLFEVIVTSEEAGSEKPSPVIFRKALAELGVPPEETAYVGDLYHRDVMGAVGIGMMPIWIQPYGTVPYRADVTVIHRLDELLELFPK